MQAWEERELDRREAREEGREEGIKEGYRRALTEQIRKKLSRGETVDAIARELEEDEATIEAFIREMEQK